MRRRRNVKRNLPSMEVVSFEGSSTFSKRRITLTTPDVVQPVEGSGSKDDDLIEEHTMQPLIMDIIDGNEGDDEDDSEDDQAPDCILCRARGTYSARIFYTFRAFRPKMRAF